MLKSSDALRFYMRKDIQEAMVECASNREIAIKYSDKGFGKRPDVLKYRDEIGDLAKQGATSFHSSEELWENPKLISSDMKKKEVERLRKGWDLIIDIDAKNWQISKITAWLIIKALNHFGIKSVSVKFSGNKGFHIGVPFESFPPTYNGKETKNLFPGAPRNIATFLLDHISKEYIRVKGNNEIIFGENLERKFKIPYDKLQEIAEKEIAIKICSKCGKKLKEEKTEENKAEFHCSKCDGSIITEDKEFEVCPKCKIIMQKFVAKKGLCDCGSNDYYREFNPLAIIEVDTILISSRHLFRMPYSLHEKSGLASIPFNPEKILLFEKKYAQPKIAKVSKHKFIDRENVKIGEARGLLEKAMELGEEKEKKESEASAKKNASFDALQEAIPEVLFPPCMKKMLEGLEDGKKRAIFILINFLKCAAWEYDLIEKRIKEWNQKNPDPLKETIINGQLRYHKRNKEKILPPNCSNNSYYKDMQICMPDNFCRKIKNPVNYAILKSKMSGKNTSK